MLNFKKMKKAIKIILYVIGAILVLLGSVICYIIFFLPNVPVEGIKVEITPARIERGKYLANHVTVCIDCHSTRDWTKFSGPLVLGTEGKGGEMFDQSVGLPGTYISKNITPFNLKDWTDGEIFRAITCGVEKKGKALFPIMPYINYGGMDREDVYSIIAYIKTLKPQESTTAPSKSDFPMNIIIHTIPTKANYSTKPDTADKLAYGKYLVNAASCKDCHTKFEKGKYVEGMMYAGGREFVMPFGAIQSTNLTPDAETGIGNWTKEAFITRFKAYDPTGGYEPNEVQSNEFNTIMPWTMYAGMTVQDLSAIYDYLHSLKPINNTIVRVKLKN